MVKLIKLLGEDYCLEILHSLEESPKRFSDLNTVCPSEKTRTRKLKALKEANLIKPILQTINKRNFIHYILTDKGKRILKQIEEING